MDKPIFILWGLLGFGIAFGIVMPLGAVRRSRIQKYVWWVLLVSGATICMYGLSHSTSPSFGRRVSSVGTASALVEQKVGGDSKFVFAFIPSNGQPVNLQTRIIVPHWGNAEVFQRRTLRVTYLDDPARSVSNEAIEIEIVSGENVGWRDSLDARPFGVWLAIPIGAMIAGLGYIGLRYRREDLTATKSWRQPTMLA